MQIQIKHACCFFGVHVLNTFEYCKLSQTHIWTYVYIAIEHGSVLDCLQNENMLEANELYIYMQF